MKAGFFFPPCISFLLFLRLVLCRPGQCFSGGKGCMDFQSSFNNNNNNNNNGNHESIYRGYHIMCAGHANTVYLLLSQVFQVIGQLQADIAPMLTHPERTHRLSRARDAFLHDVNPSTIKPLLQKILLGAKIKPPRIPVTIEEDSELRPSIAKIPGRPHIVCASPETARYYDEVSPDYHEFCTNREFGLPLTYSEFGDTIFLCPRFFTNLGLWQTGNNNCPGVSADRKRFSPELIRGRPAQDSFDGWQHLMLFRELVKLYLGDRALTVWSMPPARENWNDCLGLEGSDAGDNARSWVLWAAAVQQRCIVFPKPSYPSATPNVTGILDSSSDDGNYSPEEIFQASNFSSFVSYPLIESYRHSGVSNASGIRSAAAALLAETRGDRAARIMLPSTDVLSTQQIEDVITLSWQREATLSAASIASASTITSVAAESVTSEPSLEDPALAAEE